MRDKVILEKNSSAVDPAVDRIAEHSRHAKRVQEDVLTSSNDVICEPRTYQRSHCCSKKIRKGERKKNKKIKKPENLKTLVTFSSKILILCLWDQIFDKTSC